MITLKHYLDYTRSSELYNKHIQEIREYNRALVERYPWLKIKNYANFDPYPEKEPTDEYNWTWLDDMPDGWRLAFGEQMCAEIQAELERVNYVNEYQILQIKEKYGSLRWYNGAIPADCNVFDIINKYENLSEIICISCGKPAKYTTLDWISPYCDICMSKLESYERIKYVPIERRFDNGVLETLEAQREKICSPT